MLSFLPGQKYNQPGEAAFYSTSAVNCGSRCLSQQGFPLARPRCLVEVLRLVTRNCWLGKVLGFGEHRTAQEERPLPPPGQCRRKQSTPATIPGSEGRMAEGSSHSRPLPRSGEASRLVSFPQGDLIPGLPQRTLCPADTEIVPKCNASLVRLLRILQCSAVVKGRAPGRASEQGLTPVPSPSPLSQSSPRHHTPDTYAPIPPAPTKSSSARLSC